SKVVVFGSWNLDSRNAEGIIKIDVDGIAVESDHLEIVEKLEEGSVMTPGIVARLMGLETMPKFNSKDSIGRSRS
ncbi:hypothetical protein FRX31_015571, partial [Thalictrum thalictroides]